MRCLLYYTAFEIYYVVQLYENNFFFLFITIVFICGSIIFFNLSQPLHYFIFTEIVLKYWYYLPAISGFKRMLVEVSRHD